MAQENVGKRPKNTEGKTGNLILPKSPMLNIGNGRTNDLALRKVPLSSSVH